MSSELLSDVRYLAQVASSGECLQSKGRMVQSIRALTCGWQVKLCDPSNTCHS